ncbi:kinase-like domain-containing protein [Flagelloscypha sp. PMI_526]|nr:kinase-like domain-containing protein [Flagelloscypha sp. PMI_526]
MAEHSGKAFLKEALVWKQLIHPNILPFIGVSSTCFPNQMCLIAPYMKNGDVMHYIGRQHHEPPSYTKRMSWILGAARGMQYIHSMHLYHGDIKGANILINDEEEALLADLGITSVATSASESLGWESGTAGLKGSVRWMSPEVVMNHESKTTARDIYAFGSTILEVVTGNPPWSTIREDPNVILNLWQGNHPDRPSGFGNDVWNIVESCWACDPAKRPSATTVLERIRLSLLVLRRYAGPNNFIENSMDNSSPYTAVTHSADQECFSASFPLLFQLIRRIRISKC